MTRAEIIADERYHTCGRCRWGDLNDDFYPCNKCIHGVDKREDFWQYAEGEKMGVTIDEIKQALHKADLALRPWIVFASPSDAKAIREALPRIEEEVVIQVTELIESGKAFAMKREELEAWTYGNVD